VQPTPVLEAWAWAFALTLAVEVPLYVLLARAGRGGAVPGLARLVLAAAASSAVTHPLLWFAWPRVVGGYAACVVSGEILVVVVETVVFGSLARPVPWLRCLACSLVANAASLVAGLVLRAVGG